jgi:hypothetical protein
MTRHFFAGLFCEKTKNGEFPGGDQQLAGGAREKQPSVPFE